MAAKYINVIQSQLHQTLWCDEKVYEAFNVKNLKRDPNIFLSRFVEKRKINNYCPIRELRGKDGVFTKHHIGTKFSVGYFLGTYMTEENYNSLSEEEQYNDYSVDIVDTKIGTIVVIPNDKSITMQYINDNRNLYNNSKRKIQANVEWVIEEYKNGLPLLKIQTTKSIRKNNQVYIDYGPEYWSSRGFSVDNA